MFAAEGVSYKKTESFSPIVLDYLTGAGPLKSFYSFTSDLDGIKKAIDQKKGQPLQRNVLVEVLRDQYKNVAVHQQVHGNIEALNSADTFTVCTAHQPNIFTGPLYFVYKILHAVKLAENLAKEIPQYKFVPVYYMGSEDADLEELNHIYVDGKKYQWDTNQKGAVGRMLVDKTLVALIDELQQQVGITEGGLEFTGLLKQFYTDGIKIQDATLALVNALFGKYGLVVLIPDESRLKAQMIPVFRQDLFENTSSGIVADTSKRLGELYNVQAYPRDINLFYFKDDIRERIERRDDQFYVLNTSISFSQLEIEAELKNYPERFSPNVILRGLFQETILPNIAFIGGGGELAYWLQLKDLFAHFNIVYPVLVLRNSFLVMDTRWKDRAQKLRLTTEQVFQSPFNLLNGIIAQEGSEPHLNGEVESIKDLYESLKQTVAVVDPTLRQHIEALKVKATNALVELERKMQRAERKKRGHTKAQIDKLKTGLFPNQDLQERLENLASFYSKWGSGFINELYKHSLTLEQEFVVLKKG